MQNKLQLDTKHSIDFNEVLIKELLEEIYYNVEVNNYKSNNIGMELKATSCDEMKS